MELKNSNFGGGCFCCWSQYPITCRDPLSGKGSPIHPIIFDPLFLRFAFLKFGSSADKTIVQPPPSPHTPQRVFISLFSYNHPLLGFFSLLENFNPSCQVCMYVCMGGIAWMDEWGYDSPTKESFLH